jgi:hypothetical protein
VPLGRNQKARIAAYARARSRQNRLPDRVNASSRSSAWAGRLSAKTPADQIPAHRASGAFTHLHTGLPTDDRRVVLTAVLADATNLGLTRMADACVLASYHRLAWTAGWHLREETYRHALAAVANA